jgi:hypothetical protein
MYKKVLSRPINLFPSFVQFDGRKENNNKKVPKCSVDANYKEGPGYAKGDACTLAMRKSQPGQGPGQDAEGENKKKVLRKKGYSALL